jgi:hypothetical protein
MTNTYKSAKALGTLLFCVAYFAALSIDAQVLTKLNNRFAYYQRTNLHEEIFVHINKSFYVAGDILWFKIYNIDGATNKLLNISKVAYVELLDNNHNAVMQAKITLNQGTGNGSLYIPFSLNTGNYQLRAYTSWMKNFGADSFFENLVTIVNPLKSAPISFKPTASAYDIQFFPEGGHLVKNLTSTVAFKLTGADGKGMPCSGAIINQRNDTVVRFRTLKFGLGSFAFKPFGRTGYKAVIKINNTIVVKELPEISESGYTMHAINAGENWDVEIKNSDSTLSSNVYLIAHSKRPVFFAARAKLVNGSAHLSIEKNKLADGATYVTLFDEQQRPICERLIFKRPAKKLLIDAGTDNRIYATRKKVVLAVSSRDQDNKDIAANLSVSVFRTDAFQNEETDNHISGYLWLRSDLKGYIESPEYYLENKSLEADQALENLMISQGWTQFDWNKVLNGNTAHFKFLPEYTGPIITGRITNTTNNRPSNGIMAYLTIPGVPTQLYVAKSDSAGQLLFNAGSFYGLREIVVQTNPLQDSTYHIDIANPFSEQYNNAAIPALNINESTKQALMDNSLNMQVQNIFAANQLKQFYTPNIDSNAFYGIPTKTYMLDNYTRFTTMEEVLREYVTAIAVSKRQGKFVVRSYKVDQPLGNPLILLDGVPVFDADKLFKFDPLKVKRLEMVSANYRYGPAFFNGVMSVTTYKGEGLTYEIDPRAVVLDYDGLQLERKFYSPVYDSEAQLNSSIPDFRTALYWNPEVITQTGGKTNLKFYTGDKAGRYVGIIEGISVNGEVGSQHFSFEVK